MISTTYPLSEARYHEARAIIFLILSGFSDDMRSRLSVNITKADREAIIVVGESFARILTRFLMDPTAAHINDAAKICGYIHDMAGVSDETKSHIRLLVRAINGQTQFDAARSTSTVSAAIPTTNTP